MHERSTTDPSPHPPYEYEVFETDQDNLVRFSFIGRSGGQEVRWNVTLLTLERYYQNLFFGKKHEAEMRLRSFIELEPYERESSTRGVTVGLDLKRVDHAVILKTIIMLTKYKRLDVGRHEYGEARTF